MIRRFDIARFEGGELRRVIDTVAIEEPLQILISYFYKGAQRTEPLALAMRTPGNEQELAAGLLLSEGLIRARGDVRAVRSIGAESCNEILVELAPDVDVETWKIRRSTLAGSSCGICGKQSREGLAGEIPRVPQNSIQIARAFVECMPEMLRMHQPGFERTGGLHAAALMAPESENVTLFEDIGRHNALDKLIGHAFLNGHTPLDEHIIFMSSRSSFELIQKTAMSGATVLATMGGPSSLAIETARDCGLTLIGFVRPGRFNVYSGEWRLNW